MVDSFLPSWAAGRDSKAKDEKINALELRVERLEDNLLRLAELVEKMSYGLSHMQAISDRNGLRS